MISEDQGKEESLATRFRGPPGRLGSFRPEKAGRVGMSHISARYRQRKGVSRGFTFGPVKREISNAEAGLRGIDKS